MTADASSRKGVAMAAAMPPVSFLDAARGGQNCDGRRRILSTCTFKGANSTKRPQRAGRNPENSSGRQSRSKDAPHEHTAHNTHAPDRPPAQVTQLSKRSATRAAQVTSNKLGTAPEALTYIRARGARRRQPDRRMASNRWPVVAMRLRRRSAPLGYLVGSRLTEWRGSQVSSLKQSHVAGCSPLAAGVDIFMKKVTQERTGFRMAAEAASAVASEATAVALQTTHDGLCLQPGPLAFAPACHPLAFSLTPGGSISSKAARHSSKLHLRRTGNDKESMICADRWCIRCLARGNTNRAHLNFCSLGGYEAVVATATPIVGKLTYSWLALLVAALAVPLLVLSRRATRRARAATARQVSQQATELRQLRTSLRSVRDDARGPRLLKLLQQGAPFTEVRPRDGALSAAFPRGKPVVLRLDLARCEIDVYDASTAAAAALAAAGVGAASASGGGVVAVEEEPSWLQTAGLVLAETAAGLPVARAAAPVRPPACAPAGMAAAPGESGADDGATAATAVDVAASHMPYLYSIPPHTIVRMAFAAPAPTAAAPTLPMRPMVATGGVGEKQPWRCLSLDLATSSCAAPVSIAALAPAPAPSPAAPAVPLVAEVSWGREKTGATTGGSGPASSPRHVAAAPPAVTPPASTVATPSVSGGDGNDGGGGGDGGDGGDGDDGDDESTRSTPGPPMPPPEPPLRRRVTQANR